jgi:hypothetical protein
VTSHTPMPVQGIWEVLGRPVVVAPHTSGNASASSAQTLLRQGKHTLHDHQKRECEVDAQRQTDRGRDSQDPRVSVRSGGHNIRDGGGD